MIRAIPRGPTHCSTPATCLKWPDRTTASYLPPTALRPTSPSGNPTPPTTSVCATSPQAMAAGEAATNSTPRPTPSSSMVGPPSPSPRGAATAAATASGTPSAATSGTACPAATFHALAGVPALPPSLSTSTSCTISARMACRLSAATHSLWPSRKASPKPAVSATGA